MSNQVEKRERLLNRIHRLYKAAEAVGAVNSLVEVGAYLVLECEISRPRAIARYIRFAIRQESFRIKDRFTYYRRYYWYRYVRFYSPDRIAQKLDEHMYRELDALCEREERRDG